MCECMARINNSLKEQGLNLRLETAFLFEDGFKERLVVNTVIADPSVKKRGDKAMPFFVKFCPFCGEKLPELNPSPEQEETKVEVPNGEESGW